jgi:hypothetical protein
MMKAFPTTAQSWDMYNGRDLSGMDLRDYFAGEAMKEFWWGVAPEDLLKSARDCYAIADAMMEARKQ